MFQMLSASLHQIMGLSGYTSPYVSRQMAVIVAVGFNPHFSAEKLFPQQSNVRLFPLQFDEVPVSCHVSC